MFRRLKEMTSLNRASRKALERLEVRNCILRDYIAENRKLRERVIDLENNVEFLVNNLSPKKKELARPDNQH
jgi:hypothetical protein